MFDFLSSSVSRPFLSLIIFRLGFCVKKLVFGLDTYFRCILCVDELRYDMWDLGKRKMSAIFLIQLYVCQSIEHLNGDDDIIINYLQTIQNLTYEDSPILLVSPSNLKWPFNGAWWFISSCFVWFVRVDQLNLEFASKSK